MIKHFIIVSIFVLSNGLLAQQTNKVCFESGAVINYHINKNERVRSLGRSTTSYDWSYRYYTTSGYFLKVAYEGKIFAKNKWSLFMPMGISYINQKNKYHRSGYTMGCFGGESAKELVTATNQHLNICVGPSLQFQNKRWRYTTSVYFNNCLMVYSKTRSVSDYGSSERVSTNDYVDFSIYLSSQFSALFNVNKNIWIGPSCEVFYNNVVYSIGNFQMKQQGLKPSEGSGPAFNLTSKNVWINPGVKLQIDLKYN